MRLYLAVNNSFTTLLPKSKEVISYYAKDFIGVVGTVSGPL